jgi:hypothetical protein
MVDEFFKMSESRVFKYTARKGKPIRMGIVWNLTFAETVKSK